MLQVRLTGHAFDLEALGDLLGEGDPQIVQEAEGVRWLAASSFGTFGRPAESVRAEAQDLIDQLVGLLRLGGSTVEGVAVRPGYRTTPDENGNFSTVALADTIRIRGSVGVVVTSATGESASFHEADYDRSVLALPRKAARQIAAAQEDLPPRPADALRLLGGAVIGWSDLYKVKDHIAGFYGGPKHLPDDLADDPDDWVRFNESANEWTISGRDGRHGIRARDKRPSVTPMRLEEAERFIRTAMIRWLLANSRAFSTGNEEL